MNIESISSVKKKNLNNVRDDDDNTEIGKDGVTHHAPL